MKSSVSLQTWAMTAESLPQSHCQGTIISGQFPKLYSTALKKLYSTLSLSLLPQRTLSHPKCNSTNISSVPGNLNSSCTISFPSFTTQQTPISRPSPHYNSTDFKNCVLAQLELYQLEFCPRQPQQQLYQLELCPRRPQWQLYSLFSSVTTN